MFHKWNKNEDLTREIRMENNIKNRFDAQSLAKNVREKRGIRPLRDIESELGIPIATLSRIEHAKLPDYYNLCKICDWLGDHVGKYFVVDDINDDPITTQLRAAQKMSAETASAFMDLIRSVYMQVLEESNDEDKA
jgi:transcriptional regulator with XRE-family HTH domain